MNKLKAIFDAEVYSIASKDIRDAMEFGLKFGDAECIPMFAFWVDSPAMPFAMDSSVNLATAVVTGIRHLIDAGRLDAVLKLYCVGHYRTITSQVGCSDSEYGLIGKYVIADFYNRYAITDFEDCEVSSDGVS